LNFLNQFKPDRKWLYQENTWRTKTHDTRKHMTHENTIVTHGRSKRIPNAYEKSSANRNWLYPFHWLKFLISHIHWLFLSNLSEGDPVDIFKCGSQKEKYLGSAVFTAMFTGTCFIQKIYAPSSSLLQGKHLPFSPSPLRLNIFRLFVILSLTQLYRYTPEILWKIQRKPEVAVSVSLTEIFNKPRSLTILVQFFWGRPGIKSMNFRETSKKKY
jgi:hypothetical protein